MTNDRDDLPEGVINADPAGGWESGSVADGETVESGQRETADPVSVPDGFVESAAIQAGMDPDLRTDEQADQ